MRRGFAVFWAFVAAASERLAEAAWLGAALAGAAWAGLAQAEEAADAALGGWLEQVLQFLSAARGMSWVALASGAIMLVIGAIKVSVFRAAWDKLGVLKPFLAPALGLLAALLSGLAPEGPLTWQALALAVTSGAGAIAIHELLDLVKRLPGVGPVLRFAIELLEQAFGGAGVKERAAARRALAGKVR